MYEGGNDAQARSIRGRNTTMVIQRNKDPKEKAQASPAPLKKPSPDVKLTAPGSAKLLEAPFKNEFPVVGIGASAGGLAAFEAFFSGMPIDTDPGMAFVLVQHLAPDHKSILTSLIQRYTRMQVLEVEDGMEVRPNCAYIIPPGRDMAFWNGSLQLLEPSAPRGQRLPIDFFFRSLALDQRERAIGIVLSGTGSDGTLGIRAIKGEGGMVMVQHPDFSEFDGMPRSAIATGTVDFELSPTEMPAQLIAYVAHAFGKRPIPATPQPQKTDNALNKIFVLLRAQTAHDFSQYKPNTIHRRIERRMAVHQIEKLDDYVRYLQQTKEEVDALFRDLLIGVTSFFRDPEAFKELEEQVIPKLFEDKPSGSVVRIWSVGCSTGEEAYSLAILLQEHLDLLKRNYKVQVFATDIDKQAIDLARQGVYPSSIAVDITSERLAQFFSAEPDGSFYRIQKGIRDMLIFSEQNVIKDPPFSKINLISCRNLMIYMGGELQKKIIPLFHYSLHPGGFLFLGTSETIGDFPDHFSVVSRKAKIYLCKGEDIDNARRTPFGRFLPQMTTRHDAGMLAAGRMPSPRKLPLREITEQSLLQQFATAAVLVNSQGDILYLHGRTGMYLELTPGEAGTNNVLKMAREGLQRELTLSLKKAVKNREIIRCPGLRVKTNGDYTSITLIVRPVAVASFDSQGSALYLVIIDESPPVDPEAEKRIAALLAREGKEGQGSDTDVRIMELKEELRAKEEFLQSANEELQSSNEEMQSVNEEMQSTNEELETSKEELQSVNEELATVNAELHTKVSDLTRVNNDMNNLLAGTGIGTVFVNHALCILRFTPSATQIINLIKSDVGRPVGHIASNLVSYDHLVADIHEVLDNLLPKEAEVQTVDGKWYTMRIMPYRTLNNVIEGAVITFVDISETKKVQESLRLSEERMRVALVLVPVLICNQDKDLRYTWVHNPGVQFFNREILGKTDADLLSEEEAERLTAIKNQVLKSGVGIRLDVPTTINGRLYLYDLNVEPSRDAAGNIIGVTCAMTDISNRLTEKS